MGSNNPPWWWQIGAALKGGDMLMDTASKGTGLVDWWQNREEQKRAAEEMAKMQNDPNYTPNLSGFNTLSGKAQTVTNTDGTKTSIQSSSPMSAVLAQYQQNKQLQAKPALGKVQSALQDFGYADNNFTPSEWTQGIVQMYAPDAPVNNPYFNEGLKAFEKQGASVNDLNRGNIAQIAVTDPTSLKSYVEAGKDLATADKTRYDITADKAKTKLASDTGLATQEFSVWMTTPEGQQANGAQRQAKMNTLLPAQTSMEDRTKLATIARVNPELIAVTVGRGLDRKQEVMVDKNTGKEVNSLGEQWAISSGAPKVSVSVGDKSGIEAFVKTMPQRQEDAANAVQSNETIDKMIGLIDKGAAGPEGWAKAKAAPVLGLLGIKSQGMNDATMYQTLARTLGGSLRTQVVGPGPVTDYEQKLLKDVSGGGTTAAESARELLNYYKGKNQAKLQSYGTQIEAIRKVAPETADVYSNINLGGGVSMNSLQSAAAAELARRRKK